MVISSCHSSEGWYPLPLGEGRLGATYSLCEASRFRPFGPGNDLGSSLRWNDGCGYASRLSAERPETVHEGSAGVSSSQHFAGELFRKIAGVNSMHVPYKSGGAVVLDFIAGRVHWTFAFAASLPYHAAAS